MHMHSKPFFSIVIPVFNRSEILHHTITSVLNQSMPDFEIIIVDDGSTDNTKAVLKDYASKKENIKLIQQENRERGAARNNGLRNSSGEYVIFFDSDDVMHEDHLQTLYENIIDLDSPLFIATKFDFFNEKGKHYFSDIQQYKKGFYDYRLFLNGNPLACNICVRKNNSQLQHFEEDRKYAVKEDWLFLLQNLREQKMFLVDKVTISMYDHSKRSMKSNNQELIHKTRLAFEWIVNKIKLSAEEINTLQAHVNYFCGIHSYLDGEKRSSVDFALKAMKAGGIKIKYLLLLIKSIIGRKIISAMK